MLNKDATDIDEIRGSVMSTFAALEYVLNGVLGGEYFMYRDDADDIDEKMHYRFIDEVLSQELFSFELKKRILYKILKNGYPDLYATFPRSKLDKLQSLRNIIAHSLQVSDPSVTDHTDVRSLSFYHNGKEYRCADVYREYCELYDEVEQSLSALPNAYIL